VQILNVSSVEDLEVVDAVLMPNPARGHVSLVWDDLQHAGAQVIVYDVLGAEVMTAVTTGVIDIESLAPGRYTVVASIRDAKVTLPLMVK
jgi:sarcosine oxidase gamma subunit